LDSKNNLPKYATHSTPSSLLAIFASSWMNNSPFQAKFNLASKPAIIIFVNFAGSGLTLIPQMPAGLSLSPPLFITAILLNTS